VFYQLAELASLLADTDVEHPTPLDALDCLHDSISYARYGSCNISPTGF
jgi:hypothetical protein